VSTSQTVSTSGKELPYADVVLIPDPPSGATTTTPVTRPDRLAIP
jgi:hypothetical protein